MYIARLQLKGFKSFGGTHDLPLSSGMTAIVGPNGSGKSNLLDALRWVLGDSHASKLRVAKQGGLIFHGSASRQEATEAEVGIQMRDGTRVCTIRRRVTDAGGTVSVDGARVTLSELDDVKRAWQLSGDQFAFIGQGEVAEVIQQRPAARRMLLESLFGIDAYRKRRMETTDTLEQARVEYERLRAFIAELSARKAEIEPDVARASRAREMYDALESDRRVLYWARREKNAASMREVADEIEKLAEACKKKDRWRALWEISLSRVEGGMSELSETNRDQLERFESAKSSIASLARSAYAAGASLANARRSAAQAEPERAEQAARLEALRADRDAAAAESRESRIALEASRAALLSAQERWDRMSAAMEDARAARERRAQAAGEADGDMAALKGRMRALASSLKSLGVGERVSAKDDPIKAIKKELDELETRHAELLDAQQSAAEEHRDVLAKLQQAAADAQRSRREVNRLASRLSEVQDQAASEMYPRPVQHVLSASRLGKLKVKAQAALDAFTCPEEIAGAMEAFLGGRQFWLLVDTMDDAGECIDLLKKAQMGRATFLPLERSRPRSPDRGYRLPHAGIVGWACELVDAQPKWRPALDHLFGDLLIVEDYATGQSLVRGGFRGPVATLDGDVFQPGGTVSGGRSQKPGKTIEIKSAIARLEAELSQTRRDAEKFAKEFAKLEEAELAASSRKDEASAKLRELSEKRSELDARRTEITRDRERARDERDSTKRALAEGAIEYARIAAKKRAILSEPSAQAEAFDETLPAEIERLKSAVALGEERQRSSFVLSERVAADIKRIERALETLDQEADAREREIAECRQNLARIAARYAEAATARRIAARELAHFAERSERAAREKERRTARLDAAKAAKTQIDERLASAGRKEADLARERDELIASWEETYPYPGDGASNGADPDALRRAIRDRERAIKDLGDVNMGVLSEDESLSERLAFFGTQTDDVRAAMAELARIIRDTDEQARAVFTSALEEIDKKFCDMFKRLFTGGDARLEMIEGESLWDSGVDVVARPPGKRPQSIASLSGGEQSLSAIALLFASLEVANCPIAVLDEVDAALDEVNLRRFADLAKDQSSQRQIFVMTHRRVTMERADTLYGVTLAEPGLSQVIGVRVEDWA